MSDWNLGRVFRIVGAYFVGVYTGQWQLLASQIMTESGSVKRNKENRRAIQKYNDALVDRLEMVDLTPDAPRSLVLGRVRYVEGVRRRWSSGTHEEKLTMVVSFAGHEIDAFESWYLNDLPVTLDGSGWVQTAPYGVTTQIQETATGTLDGVGATTLALTYPPLVTPAPVAVWHVGAGEGLGEGSASVSISGTTATVTGGQVGAEVKVHFWRDQFTSYVRIRPYLGAPGQNVGAALAAEYPGQLTSADRFEGFAVAVVDMLYNTDVFPQGRSNVTAVMRGAKCLDPRSGATVWTQNPALHALRYATWLGGWAMPSVPAATTADVVAAADVCDISTGFTLRMPGGGTSVVTLPRHRSGLAIASDADYLESMDAIIEAMAGRSGWAAGAWRLRAGALKATAATVTADWLVRETKAGKASDDPHISAVQSVPRDQRYNRVTGRAVDPAQRYQLLPFPAVQDAVLVAAKGPRPLEVEFQAVDHVAHAQHLASILIRQAQAGLRLEMICGEQAALLELFDVVAVTIDKYGYAAKTFEVVGWEWQQEGAYKVQLAEITAALFTPLAELTGRDPAPDSNLRAPWDVEQITGVTVTSGTPAVTDSGSIITRTTVSWAAAVGETIRQGGQIEVQYAEAAAALPTGDWPSWPEAGNATRAVIPGLLAPRFYWFRVRAVQPLPLVRGAWSVPVLHQVDAAAQAALQAQIVDALADAAAAQATADGKIDSFWQASAPGTASEGDLWFDTDDGLRQYRWTSGTWVVAADTRIGTAISNAADAQATADGKVLTFFQAGAPTATALGDLWVDSDDSNMLYRWSGTVWAAVRDGGITAALADAAAAQATADGKIDSFWQTTAPGTASEGDLWFDTDDGLRQYRWTSGTWVVAADTRIGTAIGNAATAQATADGKVTTFVTGTTPTAEGVGDLWLNSADGNKLSRWNGSSWVAVPLGTGAIAANAATEVVTTTGSSLVTVTGTFTSPDGFASIRNTLVCTVSFTAAVSGQVLVVLDGVGSFTNSLGTLGGGRWSIQDDGATFDVWKRVEKNVQASQSENFPVQSSRRFAVTGGVSYAFSVYASKLNTGDTFTVNNFELRAEIVYR